MHVSSEIYSETKESKTQQVLNYKKKKRKSLGN